MERGPVLAPRGNVVRGRGLFYARWGRGAGEMLMVICRDGPAQGRAGRGCVLTVICLRGPRLGVADGGCRRRSAEVGIMGKVGKVAGCCVW